MQVFEVCKHCVHYTLIIKLSLLYFYTAQLNSVSAICPVYVFKYNTRKNKIPHILHYGENRLNPLCFPIIDFLPELFYCRHWHGHHAWSGKNGTLAYFSKATRFHVAETCPLLVWTCSLTLLAAICRRHIPCELLSSAQFRTIWDLEEILHQMLWDEQQKTTGLSQGRVFY